LKNFIFNKLKSYFINKSIRHQQNSFSNDLEHWGLSINEKGFIAVNGISTMDIVSKYGSPLLVVNHSRLLEDAISVHNAVKSVSKGSKVVYSYKTNCIPGILKEIHRVGIGAEVVSPYELWLAEKLNVPGDEIVYNGVNKTEESLVRAIRLNILATNIDSLSEIDRVVTIARRLGIKARVGIRLGFVPKAQFGLEVESGEAMEACRRIVHHKEWLELHMVHFCVTSNARGSGTHQHYAKKSLEFIKEIKEQTGVVIRYLDIGGGIGVPTTKNMNGLEYGLYRLFGSLPKPPDFEDFEDINLFMERVSTKVRENCSRLSIEVPDIISEPGRFVTSRGEFLLSTVLTVKKKSNGQKFAITDAGRLSLTFPMDFEWHSIFVVDQSLQREKEPYHVMGRICTSADWMAKNVLLPKLREGDVLATMDAGAYFSSYSTNFAFPRPPIVMVEKDGNIQVIRHGESFEHLVALDTVF